MEVNANVVRVHGFCVSLVCAAFASPCVYAQRANENVVEEADDAFGTIVGNDAVGLYGPESVRGFSPTSAGNVRIDGLYFDPVAGLSARLTSATSIRVGPSALEFPFPGPTGVVDYSLRRPRDERAAYVYASVNTYGGATIEADVDVPLRESLTLTAGAAGYVTEYADSTNSRKRNLAVSLRWRPTESVALVPFYASFWFGDDESRTTYFPKGEYLPARAARRRFIAPEWAAIEEDGQTAGLLSRFALRPGWELRSGFFHTEVRSLQSAADLALGVDMEGEVEQRLVFVDPPSRSQSTSGEVRLTRKFTYAQGQHSVHTSLRARDRAESYGGSDAVDLGPGRVEDPIRTPRPAFRFGPVDRDAVRQWTAGLAYEGRWPAHGALSGGIQRTDYRKRVSPAEGDAVSSAQGPVRIFV